MEIRSKHVCTGCEQERKTKNKPLRTVKVLPAEITNTTEFSHREPEVETIMCEYCDGDALPRAFNLHRFGT